VRSCAAKSGFKRRPAWKGGLLLSSGVRRVEPVWEDGDIDDQDTNSDGEDGGILYDRSVGLVWSGARDGAINILGDVLLVLAQVGHNCQAPP
jgi:hypothetical protein